MPIAIAVFIVGCALVWGQLAPHREISGVRGLYWYHDYFSYGWPLRAAFRTDRHDFWQPGASPIDPTQSPKIGWVTTSSFWIRYFGLLINVAAALTMLTATALTARYWMARPRRWYQVSLLEMLILFGLIGILISLYLSEFRIYGRLGERLRLPMHYVLPLPVSCVLLFGVGCTVFLIGRVASTIISRLISACRPDSIDACMDVTAGPTGLPSPAQGAALGRVPDNITSPNGA